MKAAWQFIARNGPRKSARPVGYGVIRVPEFNDYSNDARMHRDLVLVNQDANPSYRTLTGRVALCESLRQ